jgi:hypothetical protein
MEKPTKYLIRGRFEGNFKTDQQKVLVSGDPFPIGEEHRVKIFRGIITNTEEVSDVDFSETKGLFNFQEINNIQICTSRKWSVQNDRIFSLSKMKLMNVEVSNVQNLNGKTVGVIKGDVLASVVEGTFDENPNNPNNLPDELTNPQPNPNFNNNKNDQQNAGNSNEHGGGSGSSDRGNSPGGNDSNGNGPNIGNNPTPLWRRKGCNDKWLRWLLFIIAILALLYLLSKCTQFGEKLMCKYDEDRYRAEWKKFKIGNDSLETKIDSLKIDDEGHFVDADFLIVTYYFDSIAGKDLDTRTCLINPVSSDTLGYGFCRDNKFSSTSFLSWAGDNRGFGAESCLIDLRKFSKEEIVQIDCSAIWWSERVNGNITLDIRAFKGGTVNQVGREFINFGGDQKGYFRYPDNITKKHTNEGQKVSGQYIGTITFNKEINYLSLDKY